MPERDDRVTSLTINNLRVWQVADVLTLLQDVGYAVEINIDKEDPTVYSSGPPGAIVVEPRSHHEQ